MYACVCIVCVVCGWVPELNLLQNDPHHGLVFTHDLPFPWALCCSCAAAACSAVDHCDLWKGIQR